MPAAALTGREPLDPLRPPGMSDEVNPKSGLTEAEQRVLVLACELWGAWSDLPAQHPDDAREVCNAVHVVQNLLALRIARRHYPEEWVDLSRETTP